MHSSDETGDDRKGLATTGGATADGETAKLPAHAFRERIRRASVAAAQSTIPPEAAGSADGRDGQDPNAHSLVAPEQSGVHDRTSDEPAPPDDAGTGTGKKIDAAASGDAPTEAAGASPSVAAAGGSSLVEQRWAAARAWPFAGAARDDRPPQYHTQIGLGIPQRPAASASKDDEERTDSDGSDARRRMDTRDTKRSIKSGPAGVPGAHKITPPRPYRAHDASKWSPTSTKPQRASLLRGDTAKPSPSDDKGDQAKGQSSSKAPKPGHVRGTQGAVTQPSINVNIASSLDTGESEVSRLAAAPLDPGKYSLRESARANQQAGARKLGATVLDGAGKSQTSQSASGAAAEHTPATQEGASPRARRYTPKQRPTQRRGRSQTSDDSQLANPDAPNATDATDATAHATIEQSDSAQTHAVGDIDPRELARTVPDLRIPMSSRPPALPFSMNVQPPVTPDTPTQPRGRPVPRLPLGGPPHSAFSPPPAFSSALSPPPAFAPPRQDSGLRGPRSPFPPAVTLRGDENAFSSHEASIVIDPTLHGPFTEVHSSQLSEAPAGSAYQPSGYQPLPSDPAAFEQLMREQAASRGSRLNWKQQATLLIPRESLAAPEERTFINPKVGFGFLAATAAGAILMFGISQFGDQSNAPRVATDTSTSAAQAAAGSVTVIATEPSGAELLFDGAVVGNTPLEVPRPPRGQVEHTYVVRLRGFTQELVRLTSDSQTAIRVTLTPETGVP